MNLSSITFQDFSLLAPELTLAILGFVVLVLGMLFPRMYSEALAAIVLIGLALAFVFAVQHWGQSDQAFYGMISVDKFSVGFDCLFIIAASLTLLLSLNALEEQYLLYSEYFALIIFATLGMMLMASSAHLLTLFLGLETLSVSLYVLAGFRRTDQKALEASFKYFLLGAFASGFLLYGIALVYGTVGSASLTTLAETMSRPLGEGASSSPGSLPSSAGGSIFITGMVLMVIGFGFKIALVPFHTWAPDVYQGAPTPISAFMATGSKAAGFAALLRVLLSSGIMADAVWQKIFWVMAVATMTIGNIIALRQENIKRMLAYSSIAHAGYILVGAIANNEIGYAGVLFYLLSYLFMNVGAFGVVAFLAKSEQEYVTIAEYRGLAYRRPFAAVAMAIFMFSLSGIPPTAGFLAKFYVFSGAVQAGYIWLVILGVINSMISLYYYLGIVVVMFMHEPEGEKVPITPLPAVGLALLIAVFGTLNLGLFPGQWMDTFQALARSLM
ncbi:MAG: NADH-quinone oxidoreductase subunit N [candidate division KSB1 bacterium]|nr:NADH-quinone oxidoreductase subunit N [candidate division KSB1 bacterium]MDZ7303624.1 NADH-quinone oxidoreductase subunit N [candidate division KSB1 bacterium]MDZ7312861.1 NADH-quinone oxidoreductase subunit N [candidate division KSB1 bacterium]